MRLLVEEVEEEIAGYPLVAHALCVANNLLVGIVDFAAAVDVAQNAALAVAHGAIVEDIANALIVVVVDLQTLDKSDLLAVLLRITPSRSKKPIGRESLSRTVPLGEMRPML